MAQRLPALIQPYSDSRVVNCSYELSLGAQVVVTGSDPTVRRSLSTGEQVSIPPGQFAHLLTRECVEVPNDSLALISVKSRLKLYGLINVSGFHVDPGFVGHLLFSVYNAGSQAIVLSEGAPVFLMWYATLDIPTANTYDGARKGLDSISDDDVMKLQGDVFTPHALAGRVAALERQQLDERLASLEAAQKRQADRKSSRSGITIGVIGTLIAAGLIGLATWVVSEVRDGPSPGQSPAATTPP